MALDQSEPPALRVIDMAVRLVVLGLLVAWCFTLLRPFLAVLVWAAILAVAVQPVFALLGRRLGRTTAAALLSLAGLAIVLGPVTLLATGLAANIQTLLHGGFAVPPPPAFIADWPLVGPELFELWGDASANLRQLLERFEPQARVVLTAVLDVAATTGLALLQLMAAVIIAGIMLTRGEAAGRGARLLAERLSPGRGTAFVELSAATVRNVARGVVGIAVLQSLLLGTGFLVAGVPLAGLWALVCLVLAIVQIGPTVVVVGVLVFAWTALPTLTAALLTAWLVPVTLMDNVLRPIIMSQGLPVPMLVIFTGVIGGTLAHGLVGLFIGPVILALGYELLRAWVAGPPNGAPTPHLKARASGEHMGASGV